MSGLTNFTTDELFRELHHRNVAMWAYTYEDYVSSFSDPDNIPTQEEWERAVSRYWDDANLYIFDDLRECVELAMGELRSGQ